MTKIPKDSNVGDRMNLWYRQRNFIHLMLQNCSISRFFQNIMQNFINFPMSIISSKKEFGARRYGQNTEGYSTSQDNLTLLKRTSGSSNGTS
jgi:hypothetical protein